MKKTLIFGLVGTILLLTAVGMVILSRVAIVRNEENALSIVEELWSVIPSAKTAIPDDRANTEMPSLELNGTDFCGIIEIPSVDCVLPISARWDEHNIEKYPHRFFGSVYNKSLIIGASDNKAQFDFLKTISPGDKVFITDVTGARYVFSVDTIEKSDSVDFEYLSSLDSDLILFAKNTYGFDYTLIRCTSSLGA